MVTSANGYQILLVAIATSLERLQNERQINHFHPYFYQICKSYSEVLGAIKRRLPYRCNSHLSFLTSYG